MFTGKVPTEGTKMNKNRAAIVLGVVAALATMVAGANSQGKKEGDAAHKIVHFGDLKWTPIINGGDLASVSGGSNVGGAPVVVRLRCVGGAQVPAQWRPNGENVT